MLRNFSPGLWIKVYGKNGHVELYPVSNVPGNTYLSHNPGTFYGSIIPVDHTCIINRYLNACNVIDWHKKLEI